MSAGLAAVRAGATENDVAAGIMHAAIKAGSEYVGMEPFVASGPRSGLPHATWRRRRIRNGDVVVLETAACRDRYHAASFRTVVVGRAPREAHDWYAVCGKRSRRGWRICVPAGLAPRCTARCRRSSTRAGRTEAYRKRSGYSIGIAFAPDWGEGNVLSLYRGVDVVIEPGMVFHVPITLRDYGRFTVAVSETVEVTARARDSSASSAGTSSKCDSPPFQPFTGSNPSDHQPEQEQTMTDIKTEEVTYTAGATTCKGHVAWDGSAGEAAPRGARRA